MVYFYFKTELTLSRGSELFLGFFILNVFGPFFISLFASMAHDQGKKYFAKTLGKRLKKASKQWVKDLPKDLKCKPKILFSPVHKNESFPSRIRILQSLSKKQVPRPEDWSGLFMDRWLYVVNYKPEPRNPFFDSGRHVQIASLFDTLGTRLTHVCNEDPDLFQTNMAQLVEGIKEDLPRQMVLLESVDGKLDQVEQALEGMDQKLDDHDQKLDRIDGKVEALNKPKQTSKVRKLKKPKVGPVDVPPVWPLPEGSRIVYEHYENFVGRVDDLKAIAKSFKNPMKLAISSQLQSDLKPVKATIAGMGGVGKTQLANAFAHHYGNRFKGGVYWMSFADPANVPTEVVECGISMGVATPEMKQTDAVRVTTKAWQDGVARLLIFDNCEEEDLLDRWCPKTGACRVLITSRRQQWSPGLAVAIHSLDVLNREKGAELLLKLCSRLNETDPNLARITDTLGGLPLALHLAGSFLVSYPSVTTADYLKQLGEGIQHSSLQGRGSEHSPTQHDLSIRRTFEISFEKLDAAHPGDGLALALLARAACFMPGERIPRELLLKTLAAKDDLDGEDAAKRLINLGLLEATTETEVRLHRLLVDFVSSVLPLEEAVEAVENTLWSEAKRLNHAGDPRPLSLWSGHLKWVTDHADQGEERAGGLCNTLGFHFDMVGNYAGAKPYYEQALAIRKKVLGEEHPDTAQGLNNMGTLHQAMGDLEGAKPYYGQALAIRKKVLGEEHPDTAQGLNNLGMLLKTMGDLEGAKPYYEQALAIRKKVLGEEHPDTAGSLNNLGMLLEAMGDLEGAKPYLEQALAIRKKVLGEEHPDTAQGLNNMGYLHQAMGDLAGAKPYLEQALRIFESRLGPTHPHTITVRLNLESLKREQQEAKG